MDPEYKLAIRLSLEEKRLWLAGLLSALGFTEAWWMIFEWGPEYLGEKAGNWLPGSGGKGPGQMIVFILVAMVTFVFLKAMGYLGEMILVEQVSARENGGVPLFMEAYASSRNRYLPFATTLLLWDTFRVMVIYFPALIVAIWDRLDPNYNFWYLYFIILLMWMLLLLIVYIPLGIAAMLAVRLSFFKRRSIFGAWLEGLALLKEYPMKFFTVWLQALVADIFFFIVAWPFSALVPWAVGLVAHPIGFAPIRWLLYSMAYIILAAGLIIMQTMVQCYKSSLWTVVFLGLSWEEKVDTIVRSSIL